MEEEQNRLEYVENLREKKKEREEAIKQAEKIEKENEEKQVEKEKNQDDLKEIGFEPKVQENMRQMLQVFNMTHAQPRLFYKPRDVAGFIEEGEVVTSSEEFHHFRSRSSSPFDKRDSPRYSDRSPYYSPARNTVYRSGSFAKSRGGGGGYSSENLREYTQDFRGRGIYHRQAEQQYQTRFDQEEWYYRRERYGRGRPHVRYGRGGFRSRGRGARWYGEPEYY